MKLGITFAIVFVTLYSLKGQWTVAPNPHLVSGNPTVVGPNPTLYLEMDEDTSEYAGVFFQYYNGSSSIDKAKFIYQKDKDEFVFSKINVNPPAASPVLTLDLKQSQISALNTPGYVRFGPVTGTHMEFDDNEIQSKGSAISPATLYLNYRGGDVSIGADKIYFDESSDKVGIGTNIPNADLDVNGITKSTSLHVVDKVGIGTSNPLADLHVSGTTKFGGKLSLGDNLEINASSPIISMIDNTTNRLGFVSQGFGKMQVYSQDDLHFHANGHLNPDMTLSEAVLEVKGDGNFTGELSAASDARYKQNIIPISNAIGIIGLLNPVSYDFKQDEFPELNFSENTRYGLIAQEVERHLPELISKRGEEEYRSLNYIDLIPILIKAIQEQQSVIQALNSKVGQLLVSQHTED